MLTKNKTKKKNAPTAPTWRDNVIDQFAAIEDPYAREKALREPEIQPRPKPFNPEVKKSKPKEPEDDPFQQLDDPFDLAPKTVQSKEKSKNPFDALDDPFTSMVNLKSANAKNPFLETEPVVNPKGEELDTGDDPFGNFV